ncbi:hypothetical protein ACWEPC_56475, partial [Nonomuraea sp. NPDC004297]
HQAFTKLSVTTTTRDETFEMLNQHRESVRTGISPDFPWTTVKSTGTYPFIPFTSTSCPYGIDSCP